MILDHANLSSYTQCLDANSIIQVREKENSVQLDLAFSVGETFHQ